MVETEATVGPGAATGDEEKSAAEERTALGGRLRRVRRHRGFSQLEVAGYLKIPRSALSHIENGRRGLDALELKRLADLYRYPASYFTGETKPAADLGEALEPLLQAAADLSRRDREELRRFAEYLRVRRGHDESPQD